MSQQPLQIKFATDAEGAKQGIDSLAAAVASNAAKMATSAKGVADNFERMKLTGTTALTALAGIVVLDVLFKTVGAAIGQASEQLERFVKLGAEANRAGVSVAFFQKFTDGAKETTGELAKMQQALKLAADTSKERFDEINPVRKRLGDIFESGYMGDYQSQGLKQFDKATGPEERIRATLVAMRELQELGEKLAAIDVGERMFGKDFAEKVRANDAFIDQMINKLDQKRDDLVTAQSVENARQLTERIETAKGEIDKFLGISINLEASGTALISIWARILEGVAVAASAADRFLATTAKGARIALDAATPKAGSVAMPNLGTPLDDQAAYNPQTGADYNRARQPGYRAITVGTELTGDQIRARNAAGFQAQRDREQEEANRVPLPPKRPLSLYLNPPKDAVARGPAGSGKESLDQVERFIVNLEKSNGLLQNELDTLGKGNVEREKANALVKLNAAAKEAGREPTEAEIANVNRLAEAHGRLADQIAEGRQKIEQFRELQSFAGNQLIDILEKATKKGASFADILGGVADAIKRAALQAAVLGTGPLAGLFGTGATPGSNNAGGLIGGLFGLMKPGSGAGTDAGGYFPAQIPAFANGTDFAPGGMALVGEKGPELLSLPRGAQVIPNHGATGGSVVVHMGDTQIDARGSSMTEGQFKAILAQNNSNLKAALPGMIADARSRTALR